jgi:hypothetical protein
MSVNISIFSVFLKREGNRGNIDDKLCGCRGMLRPNRGGNRGGRFETGMLTPLFTPVNTR